METSPRSTADNISPVQSVRFSLANRQFWAAERPAIPNLELLQVAQTDVTKQIKGESI